MDCSHTWIASASCAGKMTALASEGCSMPMVGLSQPDFVSHRADAVAVARQNYATVIPRGQIGQV